MDPARSTALAKKLVQSVARAFFNDAYVIVLDALVREKFIVYEEVAPRLRMNPKEVVGILAVLEETECLIRSQNVTFHGANWKCYYIDYQAFVNIIRYRVHMMDQILKNKEADLTRMMFECPTCKSRFTELESMKLRTKDNKRACPHCCPTDTTFASTVSEDYYRLREADMKDTNQSVRLMQEKFKNQLSQTSDHFGILDMLAELKDVPLLKNLPSDNIDRGLVTSKVADADQREEVDALTKLKYKATKGMAPQALSERQTQGGGLKVQVTTSTAGSSSSSSGSSTSISVDPTKAMPDFLMKSGVRGSENSHLDIMSSNASGAVGVVAGTSSGAVKKEEGRDGDEDEEDVAWES